MTFTIDKTTYDKARKYAPGHGYSARPSPPTSQVAHSTNNDTPNTSFESEANFLYTSPDVSAHFLVGKGGQIVQFLDPRQWQAWHAGGKQANGTWTAQPAYSNPASIGTELHRSIGDPPYPRIQKDALGWLLQQMVSLFRIDPTLIDTHGQIAIAGPYIRKSDPNDWPHADFIAWRDALFAVDPLRARTLPGIPGTSAIYTSVRLADFYTARGGLAYCGYPLKNAYKALDPNGVMKDVMPCERVLLVDSVPYGPEQALLAESDALGWPL